MEEYFNIGMQVCVCGCLWGYFCVWVFVGVFLCLGVCVYIVVLYIWNIHTRLYYTYIQEYGIVVLYIHKYGIYILDSIIHIYKSME